MKKKKPQEIIEKILKKIKKVGSEFEDHPDFKEAFSLKYMNNLLSTVKSAIKVPESDNYNVKSEIEVLSEEKEQLNRIDDVFRALYNAQTKLCECINSIKDELKQFDKTEFTKMYAKCDTLIKGCTKLCPLC